VTHISLLGKDIEEVDLSDDELYPDEGQQLEEYLQRLQDSSGGGPSAEQSLT
jgi:hypothetical protein